VIRHPNGECELEASDHVNLTEQEFGSRLLLKWYGSKVDSNVVRNYVKSVYPEIQRILATNRIKEIWMYIWVLPGGKVIHRSSTTRLPKSIRFTHVFEGFARIIHKRECIIAPHNELHVSCTRGRQYLTEQLCGRIGVPIR